MNSEYMIVHSAEDMADAAAALWYKFSSDAVIEHGSFSVAVSGGKTPENLFRRLGSQKENYPWKYTKIFQVDERHVPHNHPDSNYAMIKKELIDGTSLPPENFFSIPVNSTPVQDAEQYSFILKNMFGNKISDIRFDLIILGLGSDGHTASLFPGDWALSVTDLPVCSVRGNIDRHDRITITLPVINQSRNIIFLISGLGKSEKAYEIIKKKSSSLPAGMIRPQCENLIYLLDEEAAALF